MRSPYTLDSPPPRQPPAAVVEVTAWVLAADIWHGHQPDSLLGTECAECHGSWPCPSWEVADSILADVCPPGTTPRRAADTRTGGRVPRSAGSPLRPANEPATAANAATPASSALASALAPPAAEAESAADPAELSAQGTGRHAVAADRPSFAQRAGGLVPATRAGTPPRGRRRRAEPADGAEVPIERSAERLVGHRARATQELPVLGNLPRALRAARDAGRH
ncbi:hypothetical protein AB0I55_09940 [Actinocatenispora sera]|uniref:hypothetical protein n=1 Tax=Actinocatenispora sera TaxID=390989 RepID=UPI0033D1D56F